MPDDGEKTVDVSDALSENELECDNHIDPKKELGEDEDYIMGEALAPPSEGGPDGAAGEVKKKYDPKDPSRPRRKKARRACFACQRAHLTCGDERPCQRCIKRGLADSCMDGVRKKAKYLHDAPAEALRPVLGPTYTPSTASSRPPASGPRHSSSAASDASSAVGSSLFSSTSSNFVFSPGQQTPVATLPEGMPFGGQQSPLSPTFQGHAGLGPSMRGVPLPVSVTQDMANHLIFDPSNPALFNFNLDGLNFRNTYGGVEMAMLNHMSAGAADTPPGPENVGGFGAGFGNSRGNSGAGLEHFAGQAPNFDRSLMDNMAGLENLYPNGSGNLSHGLPFAVAIATGPQSLHSPSTDTNSPQPTGMGGFEGSPTGTFGAATQTKRGNYKSKPSAAGPFRQSILGKRTRDPSSVYETVRDPYPYVKGFHKLIFKLQQRRFGAAKLLRIAKSLASIRPSFIACTRALNRQDLVFMEKCFQRTLMEYEDFTQHCSAPTIVCRRTGEVAMVNKEFTALTGWTKGVILGKEPNLNANGGGQGTAGAGLASGRLGALKPEPASDDSPEHVFIAELLDEDSVIDVYEDFAQLAFENSRGHVTRKCKLIKYRTKESMDSAVGTESTSEDGAKDGAKSGPKERPGPLLSSRVTRIDTEHAISRLEKDGKVDCTYTWMIKRDVFDIPMMIVMNFLPCYYRDQEPQFLPV